MAQVGNVVSDQPPAGSPANEEVPGELEALEQVGIDKMILKLSSKLTARYSC